MGRSGYSDDAENVNLWRGAVASSIRGKRGQAFFREMLAALDTMPEKRLVPFELEQAGEVCALGAVGKTRGVAMDGIDAEDNETIARLFGIPHVLACEIMYENDEHEIYDPEARRYLDEAPEDRFIRMRAWIASKIASSESKGTAPAVQP